MRHSALPRPFFYICVGLFLLHQVLQKGLHVQLPLPDAYLDPLLCVPILLGLVSVERGLLFQRAHISLLEVIFFVVLCSALFELGFPRWSPAFTYDAWDVLAYAAGGVLFWYFGNPEKYGERD